MFSPTKRNTALIIYWTAENQINAFSSVELFTRYTQNQTNFRTQLIFDNEAFGLGLTTSDGFSYFEINNMDYMIVV